MNATRASVIAIAAALCAAAPASAVAPQRGWTAIGDWEIAPIAQGTCAIARPYASGTYLGVRASGDGSVKLVLANEKWRAPVGAPWGFLLVLDGDRAGALRPDRGGEMFSLNSAFLPKLAAARSLEVYSDRGVLIERLDPTGAAAAVERLRDCISPTPSRDYGPLMGVAAPPPPPPYQPPSAARSPRPKSPPSTWINESDYPSAALRAGEQGTVTFRLDVDVEGRVTACTVIASSGSAILDSVTCRLLTERVTFEPARDAKGNPTSGHFRSRIGWRIPEPPPPEPAPPAPN
jgi:TonB family protein